MTEHKMYRNIGHVPKIWGVQLPMILLVIVVAVLIIGVGMLLSSNVIGRLISFIFGLIIAVVCYIACLVKEKNDELNNKDAFPFVRNVVSSQCGAEVYIVILDKKENNKLTK